MAVKERLKAVEIAIAKINKRVSSFGVKPGE
jgi:hypothetical protein